MQWTPAIDRIVERFGVEEPWVRSRFASTLVGFGSLATSPLSAYIRVNHVFEPAGTISAIETMAAIGDWGAAEAVLDVVRKSQNDDIRIRGVEALGLLGGPNVLPELQKAMMANDWRIRAKAATALGELGLAKACPVLAKSLRDPNFWVRRNSAESLARLNGGRVFLLAALEGDDAYAADAAAEALVDSGDLALARERVQAGTATSDDFRLLAFIEEDEMVGQ